MSRFPFHRRTATIVRLLPLLDEADILEHNLRWYAESGIRTVAFDNASSDATAQHARRALEQGLLAALDHSDERLGWPEVTAVLLDLAEDERPDIVLALGADEFLEVSDGTPLLTAVGADLSAGYDALRVDTVEFCLTDADEEPEDPTQRMRYYGPHQAVLRERGLRWAGGIEWPEPSRFQSLAEVSRSPRRYINRHYPLRSPQQTLQRIRAGRLRPVLAGHSAAGLAPLARKPKDLFLPARRLHRYHDDHQWNSNQVLADVRLFAAEKLARRMVEEHEGDRANAKKLHSRLSSLDAKKSSLQHALAERQRELSELKKAYGKVRLERDRLIASGARPDREQLAAPADWYDDHYRLALNTYDAHYRESIYLPVWEEIAERLTTSGPILEIGCGTGQLAELLFDRDLRKYVGFDFSELAVELARKRVPDAEFHVADARTTSLVEQATYEVALSTEVLEHLDDDLALLRRIRAGTRVLATVPNFDSTSHLRFFAGAQDISDRYGQTLDALSVTRFTLPGESALFLLDGTSRGDRDEQDLW